MVEIILTSQQVRSAASLVACSREEAATLLQQIRDDYLACPVFLELGRDDFTGPRQEKLHRVGFGEIMRHVRPQDSRHLAECLDEIGTAFRHVRADDQADQSQQPLIPSVPISVRPAGWDGRSADAPPFGEAVP